MANVCLFFNSTRKINGELTTLPKAHELLNLIQFPENICNTSFILWKPAKAASRFSSDKLARSFAPLFSVVLHTSSVSGSYLEAITNPHIPPFNQSTDQSIKCTLNASHQIPTSKCNPLPPHFFSLVWVVPYTT